MRDKTVVITGATSGLGEVAAVRLARAGARIVLVARDRKRAANTMDKLMREGPQSCHEAVFADLSQLSEMRRAAAELASRAPTIDVLINNAGAIFPRRLTTVDGLEMSFALNHMAYFIITVGLLDNIRAAYRGRIISVSSDAHRIHRLDFDDLQTEKHRYTTFRAYCVSKLCNVLFTQELARRLAKTNVTANALHPGFVNSRFYDTATRLLTLLRLALPFLSISPERASDALVHLATSPAVEGVTGQYFSGMRPVKPSVGAECLSDAVRLWSESEQIARRVNATLPVS